MDCFVILSKLFKFWSDFHGYCHRGSRDGAVVIALASHQGGPGSISRSDAFVLVLFSASRDFVWVLWFSSLSKNQHAADSIWL